MNEERAPKPARLDMLLKIRPRGLREIQRSQISSCHILQQPGLFLTVRRFVEEVRMSFTSLVRFAFEAALPKRSMGEGRERLCCLLS